jgi:hypothetical protein
LSPDPSKRKPPARRWWATSKLEVAIGLLGLVAVHLVFASGAFRQSSTVDPTTAAQFGDFIGGYVGTLFLLASVLLLVMTLRGQNTEARITNFENKYFTMLELHRANVSELELGGSRGRKVFVWMMRELRELIFTVRAVATDRKQELTQAQVAEIAYCCFFLRHRA